MDKTTTWLVRGASAIVIIFGLGYFAKPQLSRFMNYRAEQKQYKSLTQNEKALLRCKNFPKIAYPELLKKINKKEIKEWFTDYENYQIKTVRGKKFIITGIPSNSNIFSLLDNSGIPLKDEEKESESFSLLEHYENLICK